MAALGPRQMCFCILATEGPQSVGQASSPSRVWLYVPPCLCDVVKEIQANLRAVRRALLGQTDMFICGWSCGSVGIKCLLTGTDLGRGVWPHEAARGLWVVST